MNTNLSQLFNDAVLLDYLKARQQPAMLGDILFPDQKIESLKFKYIKGANNLPVAATIHGFDTESEIASREGFDEIEQKIALIKRKIKLGEEELIMINNPRNSQEQQYALQKLFNDVDAMIASINARIEAMRFEVFSTGNLVVNENNVKVSIPYGTPADHQEVLAATSKWSDPSSKPLDDIYRWVNKIVGDTGVTPTRALTSQKVVAILGQNTSLRKSMFGVNSDKIATKVNLNELFVSLGLPAIENYDGQYRVQGADGKYTNKRYLGESKFVVFPEGEIGETIHGLTAEELKLRNKPGIDINSIGNIVAMTYTTEDPVAEWTKAVTTALPSFPVADQVFQSDVI